MFHSPKEYTQLLRTLATDQKIIYLCGAGASMSLGGHNLSWTNWILAGKEFLTDSEKAELDRRVGSWATDELINAVTYLIEKLKASGSYESFMKKTIGSLHPIDPAFKDALRKICRAGDLITTTNYDLEIEEAVDIEGTSYSSPADILSIINGNNKNRVIHLHGQYDSLHGIDDIVADDPQYKSILANAGAQFIQNLIGTHPLMVVGCGGTVEDPNLAGFLSFVVEKLGVSDVPYYFLMRSGDTVPELPANAIPIFYGDDYSDLPLFLQELAELRLRRRAGVRTVASINPYSEHDTVTSAFGRMHFSNRFSQFVGRTEEIQNLNVFLDADTSFSWWTVLGDGGIGKSRLILEWLKTMPSNWFGFFAYKRPAEGFELFTDTVVVLDYILGDEQQCAAAVSSYLDAFETSPYKLRIIFIEREDAEWMKQMMRSMNPGNRLIFEAGGYGAPLCIGELSHNDEIEYVENYLTAYLPLLPDNDFVRECQADTSANSIAIVDSFRASMLPVCYRPLYLSIFTEVWLSKKGELSFQSAEDLLSEYLSKEIERWKSVLDTEELTDSYLRLLAMACAIGFFDITDNYGDNYLEDDCNRLTEFLDDKSGRPGADNTFQDLFISMNEPDDDGSNPILDVFHNPEASDGILDSEDVAPIREMSADERFAFSAPYTKLTADPNEVYLDMMVRAGAAEESEIEELERVRTERIKRVNALPDHAWVIEPVFPDIIKEFIVTYTVNERDVVRFTKLARANSIMGLESFLTRALEDWPDNRKIQKMVVTPPDEMLNYSEYYFGLLVSLRTVVDIKSIEDALIASDPCFLWQELELWRRIAIVLTERGDVDRLFDSSCRFFEYLDSIDGMVHVREEAVDVIEGYCVGLHNAGASDKHRELLIKCEEKAALFPDDSRIGTVLCDNYSFLVNSILSRNNAADISAEWEKIVEILKRYNYPKDACKGAMQSAHDYMINLLRKQDLEKMIRLEEDVENIYGHVHVVEIAEVAALCAANIYSVYYEKKRKLDQKEYGKVRNYYSDFPESMHIRSAYIVTARTTYLDTSSFRRVPGKVLNDAKTWSLQYPGEIEFQEGYFGLLLTNLEYAQIHDMRNEQRRVFREMKAVAARANYTEYGEENELQKTVEMLQRIYGY